MKHRHLRMISYNIHKGYTTGNRSYVLHRIRDAIRSVHADLVFLQEVMGSQPQHGSQFEYLADELWPHYAYGRNAVYTSGHHGNAILSKFPFSFWENIDISTNRLEKRGLLHGVIEIPHKRKPLHAICVHLGLLETERQSQIRQICRRIDSLVSHDEPLIIGGDFNDWRTKLTGPLMKQAEVREAFLELHGSHARTFPSWLPALKLDRVYFRKLALRKASTLSGPPWSQLSDHAALYVEVDY
jgi:endonuclease/exonuclease/phosphatase family metal-dependent hydrolase